MNKLNSHAFSRCAVWLQPLRENISYARWRNVLNRWITIPISWRSNVSPKVKMKIMDIGSTSNIPSLLGHGIEIWMFPLNSLTWVIIKIDVTNRALIRKKRKYTLFLSDSISSWTSFCFSKLSSSGDKYSFINLFHSSVSLESNPQPWMEFKIE